MIKTLFNNANDAGLFDEAVYDAISKHLSGVDADAWLKEHREDLERELYNHLDLAVRRVDKPLPVVQEPVLKFRLNDKANPGASKFSIAVWVGDAGQQLNVGPHRSMQFGYDGTATLVYDYRSNAGHQATEYNIAHPPTWLWIRKWMEKGFQSDGMLHPNHITAESEGL